MTIWPCVYVKLHLKSILTKLRPPEYSTVRKGNLTQHIKSVHLKEKFDYKLCNYQATTIQSLKSHNDNVHLTKITTCLNCNKTLKQFSLANHMKIVHGDKSKYYCKMCPFQTIYQKSLKTHTENVHQKLRKHNKIWLWKESKSLHRLFLTMSI